MPGWFKRKTVTMVCILICIGLVASCSNKKTSGDESELETSGNGGMNGTQITSPDKIPFPSSGDDSSSQPTNVSETTEADPSSSESSATASGDIEYIYFDDSYASNRLERYPIPGKSFAANRIPAYPHITRLKCFFLDEPYNNCTIHLDMYPGGANGTYVPVPDSTETASWSESTWESCINCTVILDGINVPTVPKSSENPVDAFTASYWEYLDRLLISGYVYLETDGVVSNIHNGFGEIHGYIYFVPDSPSSLMGQTIHTEELVQLQEVLLAMGFAEPDPSYTGPYASIYAQYPAFKANMEGYPIINSLPYGREAYRENLTFYDPAHASEYYPDYGFDT